MIDRIGFWVIKYHVKQLSVGFLSFSKRLPIDIVINTIHYYTMSNLKAIKKDFEEFKI